MIIGSHNSWTYLRPQKWWMRLLRFTARCQRINIIEQHNLGTRCFDLRIRFGKDGKLILAHGIIEYEHTEEELLSVLAWLNTKSTEKEKVYLRVINEIRSHRDYNTIEVMYFSQFCKMLEEKYKKLYLFCGSNLLPKPTTDYDFGNPYPPMTELYSSVCSPRLVDDWWPWWYAYFNNYKNIRKTENGILLMDFVDVR